jgi:hypothetical protein
MAQGTKKTITYGKNADGTLNVCRAKPQNRGRGNCPHGEHVSFEEGDIAITAIERYNEQILADNNGYSAGKDNYPDEVSVDHIQTSKDGVAFNSQELEDASLHVAASFSNEDWKFIQQFYQKYETIVPTEDGENLSKKQRNQLNDRLRKSVNDLEEYLNSDDETAVKVRSFLGPAVDVKDLSEVLVFQVGAMTTPMRWSMSAKTPIKRCIMTSLNNDMTKERYVASVLFFGARCCYCNRVLRKSPPPSQQASGEHITPISPLKEGAVSGGTRFGNMALACVKCNKSRSNNDLEEWVNTTECIKPQNREATLNRIKVFRQFALYNEYTPEQNDRIQAKVAELNGYAGNMKGSKVEGENEDQRTQRINTSVREKIKVAIYDLQHGDDATYDLLDELLRDEDDDE